MHLGGDTSAAEASARAHSARRMTRTYGQLNAGGRWLKDEAEHTTNGSWRAQGHDIPSTSVVRAA